MPAIQAILQAIQQQRHTSGGVFSISVHLSSLGTICDDPLFVRVHVVSDAFQGLSLLQRHRIVHTALDKELKSTVHALSLRLKTPVEEGM